MEGTRQEEVVGETQQGVEEIQREEGGGGNPTPTPTGGGDPTGGGGNPTPSPNPTPAPPAPTPEDCDEEKTADRCTASCIASTVTPENTLTTTCTTTICRADFGCNVTPTTVSEIRTKEDNPACTLAPQPEPDPKRELADAQAIMDGADMLEDLLAELDPDLIESGDEPQATSGAPVPTTLETSVRSSAPPPEPTSAPEQPPPEPTQTPEPPPPPPPITDRWTMHIHQQMDHEFSQVK